MPRQQAGEIVDLVIGDARQHVGQPGLRVDVVELGRLNQRQDDGGTFAAAIRSREQPRLSSECDASQRAFSGVVAEADASIVQEASEHVDALERVAAVGFIVPIVVLAIIQSRNGKEAGIVAPLGHEAADALVSELARCRTVTLDQTTSLETCRRLWAENRRQFFAPTRVPPASVEPLPSSATASGKIQDRVSPAEAVHQQGEVQ